MEELILEKVQELAPEMINSIVKLVQIDSTESQPAPDAPFGAGPPRPWTRRWKWRRTWAFIP